jgi:hypothetical protein
MTMTDDHPAHQELSALLDDEVAIHETTAMRDHLAACLRCSRELERLETGRRALSAAGLPIAPAGAMESAVSAALASAAPASPRERPAQSTGLARADDEALVAFELLSEKRHASRRYRHHQLVSKAAIAVLILGAVGGGIYGMIRMDRSQSASAERSGFPPQNALGSPKSTASQPPPLRAFVLQLRASTGSAPCAKAFRPEVESIGGTPVVVDPPAAKGAVMQAPAAVGRVKTCIGVGPAFASLWSADVSRVTIERASGPGVPAAGPAFDIALALAPTAVTDSPALEQALKGELIVEAIEQGVDLGTATVTKGPVATLTVTHSVATFLRNRLLGNGQPSA